MFDERGAVSNLSSVTSDALKSERIGGEGGRAIQSDLKPIPRMGGHRHHSESVDRGLSRGSVLLGSVECRAGFGSVSTRFNGTEDHHRLNPFHSVVSGEAGAGGPVEVEFESQFLLQPLKGPWLVQIDLDIDVVWVIGDADRSDQASAVVRGGWILLRPVAESTIHDVPVWRGLEKKGDTHCSNQL